MPILDRDDAREVDDQIERFFSASAAQRPGILRQLFAGLLDFQRDAGQLSLAAAHNRAGLELPPAAERIASLDGVHVLFVALDAASTDRVRKAEAAAVARHVREQLGEDMLLLFSNRSTSQLHWIHPVFGAAATPTLRRIVVEREVKRRTAVQQLANVYWRYQHSGSIREALSQAFDVEPVTKRFFSEYQRIFAAAEQRITGFRDPEERKQFVQTLFNRLMFVYFLSRKGWLRFGGDTDYLNALWKHYDQHDAHDNFYRDRLSFLFFEGLNNPDSRDLRGGVDFLIGDVPFLNGGLFEQSDLDDRAGVTVPDDAIRPLLTELFDQFNFTVMESTPYDIEVAVDPEMLGKVFEELVTGRHDSGAYYTPRPVVSFMCREALKGYLEAQLPELDADAAARFVDQHDAGGIALAQAEAIQQALREVTVVDPACGSGAYLVGMMQELIDLRVALYNQHLRQDARSLYELKLHIIERNLHGVDLDPFAVNIAMLRLWLALAIEYDGPHPEPLPNLDFKIVEGDSLLGPDPSQLSLDSHAIRESNLGALKSEYMRARTAEQKRPLRRQIDAAKTTIRKTLADANVPQGAVDWRIDFAEVIAEGGFDIAIANPPYVRHEKIGPTKPQLRKLFPDSTTNTSDLYCYFYARGCQLLRSANGVLAYITSNSWLRAEYGKKTRRYFTERHTPLRWLDLGKDVFESAIVASGIMLLRTGGTAAPFPSVDMDTLDIADIPPAPEHWGETRPDGDMAWLILSETGWSVLDKMRSRGTPLKDWDIAIYRGVLTGYDKAFVIDNQTKEALVAADPKSAEIIKPLLRGRDIRRYQARWQGNWLIATFPSRHLDIDDYPAIRRHLLSFGKDRLEQSGKTLPNGTRARKKTKHAWFEMQDTCAYHAEFGKEKLFWADMAPQGRFLFSDRECYTNTKGYIMTGGSLKYLCAVLNSSLITWWVRTWAAKTGMNLTEWTIVTVGKIPVPDLSAEEQHSFVELCERILQIKAHDPNADTTELEAPLNLLVQDLYGLTRRETLAVKEFLAQDV